jgi:hypothetical protein
MCREVLEGWGDASRGEWIEEYGAFHLRRRLSAIEEQRVGPAIDMRDSDEGMKRLKKIAAFLPTQAILLAKEELAL